MTSSPILSQLIFSSGYTELIFQDASKIVLIFLSLLSVFTDNISVHLHLLAILVKFFFLYIN